MLRTLHRIAISLILLGCCSGLLGAAISEAEWTDTLDHSLVFDLSHIVALADQQTHPEVILSDNQVFLSTARAELLFGVSRLWNSDDPEQIQFTNSEYGFSLLMRLGESSALLNGSEIGPLPLPHVAHELQMIPLRAFCGALQLPIVYRDGYILVGPYAYNLFGADAAQVQMLAGRDNASQGQQESAAYWAWPLLSAAFAQSSGGDTNLMLVPSGIIAGRDRSLPYPERSVFQICSDEYAYFLQSDEDVDSRRLIRLDLQNGAAETLCPWPFAADDIGYITAIRESDTGPILSVHLGGAIMGNHVSFHIVEGALQAYDEVWNKPMLSSRSLVIDDWLYYLHEYDTGMPGIVDNLRKISLSSGETSSVFSGAQSLAEGQGFAHTWIEYADGSRGFGRTSAEFLPDQRLLTTLFANDESGSTLCVVDLPSGDMTLHMPETRIGRFRLFDDDVVVFAEIEPQMNSNEPQTAYGIYSLSGAFPSRPVMSTALSDVTPYQLSADTLYYLSAEGELFQQAYRSEAAPERMTERRVAQFALWNDQLVFSSNQDEAGVFLCRDGEEIALFRGRTNGFAFLSDGSLAVSTAFGGYLVSMDNISMDNG